MNKLILCVMIGLMPLFAQAKEFNAVDMVAVYQLLLLDSEPLDCPKVIPEICVPIEDYEDSCLFEIDPRYEHCV